MTSAAAGTEELEGLRPFITNFVRRRAPLDDAEDLVQEVFFRACRDLARFPRYRERGHLLSWLREIARNIIQDHYRRYERTVLPWPEPNFDLPDYRPETLPEFSLLRRELGYPLEQALMQLTANHREVLVLHHLRDVDLRELAALLQLSEQGVKSRLFRARQALRRLLESERVALE